ncbi:MAG: HEAT repeat domain-containing protein [Deltaproteobacteria bacterium]|nr:HEAT repeat domain-containing protein [Deltaproteobacteria bacterium]
MDRKFAGLAKTATNKNAQTYDREDALRALCAMGTPEAARVLLKRFTFQIDPTITDNEEKALAFEGIVTAGTASVAAPGGEPASDERRAEQRAVVVEAVREFCRRAETLTWPLKVLRELLDDESYERELLELLRGWDNEYVRNVEPKVNVLDALEEVVSPRVREAVAAYLGDVNETVRFHAVETTYKQGDRACVPDLVRLVQEEESVRIKNKVAAGLAERGWTVPQELRERFAQAMTDVHEYRIKRDGTVAKAG